MISCTKRERVNDRVTESRIPNTFGAGDLLIQVCSTEELRCGLFPPWNIHGLFFYCLLCVLILNRPLCRNSSWFRIGYWKHRGCSNPARNDKGRMETKRQRKSGKITLKRRKHPLVEADHDNIFPRDRVHYFPPYWPYLSPLLMAQKYILMRLLMGTSRVSEQ